MPKIRNKFGAVKTEVDGITFDSRKEANRYEQLKLLERSGAICNLEIKPVFPFIVNGVTCFKMIPDFAYFERERRIVEDVKSAPTKTRAYRIKKKCIEALYSIEIREV